MERQPFDISPASRNQAELFLYAYASNTHEYIAQVGSIREIRDPGLASLISRAGSLAEKDVFRLGAAIAYMASRIELDVTHPALSIGSRDVSRYIRITNRTVKRRRSKQPKRSEGFMEEIGAIAQRASVSVNDFDVIGPNLKEHIKVYEDAYRDSSAGSALIFLTGASTMLYPIAEKVADMT